MKPTLSSQIKLLSPTKIALSCAIIVALSVVVGGYVTPGYSHSLQFISELGAKGAPYEWWIRAGGFLPAGILLLIFCMQAFVLLPRSLLSTLGLFGIAMFAAGYVVAAFFPCDPGCRPANPSTFQFIHNVGGLVGYFLAPGSLFVLALAARKWSGASGLVIFGYVTSCVALVGLLTLSPASDFVGYSQRALEISVLSWVVMLGVYLKRL